MALSGREVLLILRARDEASRTIGRVSSAMARADRDALRMADRTTKQSRQNLSMLSNAAHDVQYNYQQMSLAARKNYMESKGSLAQRSRVLQRQMLEARTYRVEQMRNIELNRRATREQIEQANEIRQQIEEQNRLRRHQGQEMMATGGAAVAMGASMMYFGVQATRGFAAAVQANIDYTQQVQKTATQVDSVAVSVKKLSQIGKQAGRDIPVAFEEIQPALYDIFSSIDVGYKGANKLLRQFAKDTVGGQTDMETATRANLQIMNAYKISVKDAANVSDFMFQLVRKGVGTYDEFAKTIGRAIPSAVRAGQSYQTVGAMMAFMTRNGVSAAMAATASARALDAISNAKTVDKLKKMGIEVRNASGNFKPLPKILDDIARKMKGMSNVQRASFLQDLFKGSGGTIQARRFFDMYFKNADEFKKRNKEMSQSAGAAQEAFVRMSETPQAKIQELKNQWMLLRIEIGEHLLPWAMKLLDWVSNAIKWFQSLDPQIRKNVIQAAALVAVLVTLLGALTAIAGGVAIFVGALGAVGASLGGMLAISTGVGAFLALLAGAAILIYKNWGQIKPKIDAVVGSLKTAYSWFIDTFGPGIHEMMDQVRQGWDSFVGSLKKAWQNFKDNVDVAAIKQDWNNFVANLEQAAPRINAVLKTMGATVKVTLQVIGITLQVLAAYWGALFTGMVQAVITFAQGVSNVISGMIQMIQGLIQMLKGALHGDWGQMWQGLQQMTHGAVSVIVGWFQMLVQAPLRLVRGMVNGIISAFQHLYNVLVGHSIVPDLVNDIVRWFAQLPGRALGAIRGLPGQVAGLFSRMASSATSRVSAAWNQIVSAFESGVRSAIAATRHITSGVTGILNGLISTAASAGTSIWSGLASNISAGAGAVGTAVSQLAGAVAAHLPHSPAKRGPLSGKGWPGYSGRAIANDLADGMLSRKKHLHKASSTMAKAIRDALMSQLKTDDLLTGKQLSSIISDLPGRQKKGQIARAIKATSKQVNSFNALGKRLAAKRSEIEKAKEDLQKLIDERQNFYDTVKRGIESFGSLGSIAKPTDVFGNEGNYTSSYIASQLTAKLKAVREFGTNAAAVLKMYGKAIYSDLLTMGPEAGNEYAKALLSATPQEQATIRTAYSGIQQAATSIATTGANNMYNAGIAVAQGMIKGLQSQEAALVAQATKMANAIAKAIKKALKIKSPSRVTRFMGRMTGKGWWLGMRDEYKAVVREAEAITKAAAIPYDANTTRGGNPPRRPPVGGGYSGSANAPTTHIDQKITIHTQEIDPRANAAKLGWELANRTGL